MYPAPNLENGQVGEEFNKLSGILQAMGEGQSYPHSTSQDKEQFWDDFLAPFASGKISASAAPSWSVMLNGVYAYSFSASAMNEIWVTFHIDHTYKPNSKLYPHIHWVTPSTNTGVVRWGIEYTFAKGHNQGSASVFPATQTIYLEQAGSGLAYEHMVVEASSTQAISSPNIEVDSIVMMRVFRDAAHANDTHTSAVFGIMADMHYQKSYWATKNKAPNFYR